MDKLLEVGVTPEQVQALRGRGVRDEDITDDVIVDLVTALTVPGVNAEQVLEKAGYNVGDILTVSSAEDHALRIAQEKRLIRGEISEGLAVCRACSSKRVRVERVQMRRADEGMNGVFECVDCGKTWIS